MAIMAINSVITAEFRFRDGDTNDKPKRIVAKTKVVSNGLE